MESPQEVKVDVGDDWTRRALNRGQTFYVPGVRNIVHIPFDGDADVLKIRPMTRAISSGVGM